MNASAWFRCLFPIDRDVIFYNDIMNICPALNFAPDFEGGEQRRDCFLYQGDWLCGKYFRYV